MDESTKEAVVLTSDDAERAASAILHHLQTANKPTTLIVVAYGPECEPVARVARSIASTDLVEVVVVEVDGDSNRLHAARAGLHVGLVDPRVPCVAVVADDARPCQGWIDGLRADCWPASIVDESGNRWATLGVEIGLVGPVSEQAATLSQRVSLTEQDVYDGAEVYNARRREAFAGSVSLADTLDPWCLLLTRRAAEVVLAGAAQPDLDTLDLVDGWGVGSLARLLEQAGMRAVVAQDVYVGRTRAVAGRPVVAGSVERRLAFYRANRSDVPRVVSAIRVRLTTLRALHLLRGVVARAGAVTDGIAVVLGNNPLDLQDGSDFDAKLLTSADRALLVACDDATPSKVAQALATWIGSHAARTIPVGCEVWTEAPNEANERAALDALSGKVAGEGPTWVLALAQDELIEDGVTREFIARLVAHPNALVSAYDLPILTLWDAPRLVREDAPWGDGGTWKGGPSEARLYRRGRALPRGFVGTSSAAPLTSLDGLRVGSVRLRRTGLLRPIDRASRLRGQEVVEDGMRVSAVESANRMGLHVLVYERENPEDVARWLDEAHGLLDAIVLVWTGAWAEEDRAIPWRIDGPAWPATGPSRALAEVASTHGAVWLHHPLADNIAEARNAGIAALRERGLTWAWFVDPDEWLADPLADARCLRRCAESTRWGWLVQTANYTESGRNPTISDSVRLSRLDPAASMVMDGRVHESFGNSIEAFVKRGVHPRLIYVPFVMQHRGMALGEARTREKLDAYERLLRLELADRPTNPGAWVSLAWHFDNDGHPDLSAECLRRAVACAGRSYLPFREEGVRHLRLARVMFEACVDRLSTGHQYTKQGERVLAWLRENAPPPIRRTESARAGDPEPLPAFPPDASGAGYDRSGGGA